MSTNDTSLLLSEGKLGKQIGLTWRRAERPAIHLACEVPGRNGCAG